MFSGWRVGLSFCKRFFLGVLWIQILRYGLTTMIMIIFCVNVYFIYGLCGSSMHVSNLFLYENKRTVVGTEQKKSRSEYCDKAKVAVSAFHIFQRCLMCMWIVALNDDNNGLNECLFYMQSAHNIHYIRTCHVIWMTSIQITIHKMLLLYKFFYDARLFVPFLLFRSHFYRTGIQLL